jgi:uncharacterized membrane-anchored protein
MNSRILLLIGAVLVFGAVNWKIVAKERLRSSGQTVFLDLAPRDPRSLMQGDYMALNFAVANEIGAWVRDDEHAPTVAVLKVDDRRVAHTVRLDMGAPLNPGELRFRFRVRNSSIWLGTNAFFFHEGEEERYRAARFGEFRVGDDGDAMLVDLRDKDLLQMR